MNRPLMASELETLVHYYYTPMSLPDENGYNCATASLIKKGLIKGEAGKYTPTERGSVYVEALLNTPLPIQIWAMRPDKELLSD